MKCSPLGLLVGLALGAAACGGEENRPAVWSYIAPVLIAPNCATSSCHSKGAAVAGLDLSTAEAAHDSLMNGELPGSKDGMLKPRVLVNPGNPAQSRLVAMLRARGADRMPPDRPLAEADIALIERWIREGAVDDLGGE